MYLVDLVWVGYWSCIGLIWCGFIIGAPLSVVWCYVLCANACYALCKFLFTLLCEIQKVCNAEV